MTDQAAVRRETVPMSLLIVDDELAVRETCVSVAEQCGMKAIGVATAEKALEVLEHSAVDILLTDLKLPRTNGVELLKQVLAASLLERRRQLDVKLQRAHGQQELLDLLSEPLFLLDAEGRITASSRGARVIACGPLFARVAACWRTSLGISFRFLLRP